MCIGMYITYIIYTCVIIYLMYILITSYIGAYSTCYESQFFCFMLIIFKTCGGIAV